MTNWKENIQLVDLDKDERIEVTCKSCGHSWYEDVKKLLLQKRNTFVFLDELESRMKCRARNCHGKVRIALSAKTVTEGFMGGLA